MVRLVRVLLIFLFLNILFIAGYFIFNNYIRKSFTVTVFVDEKGFSPSQLQIRKGDIINFVNRGKYPHWPASNIHPTHSIYPEFDPQKGILPGSSWKFAFGKEGTWMFHDHLSPSNIGAVRVSEASDDTLSAIIETFISRLPVPKNKQISKYFSNSELLPNIQKDDLSIADNKAALYSYVKKYGPEQAVKQLYSVESSSGRDCHQDAHTLGKYAYEIYGEKTFGMCSAECHSGCYHGATEAFFKEHGTANLQANLRIVCSTELNKFFSHQCVHGIGHGLTAWTNYEINDALKNCDLLDKMQDSCYSGVFMENIVGALALGEKKSTVNLESHYTKYLNDDPQYPCTVVAEKYKNACYFYQTSRMVQLFKYNFAKVADECAKVPSIYQTACFESMGRDVGGYTYNDPKKDIELCANVGAGQFRVDCLDGAVQNAFWDSSGQSTALRFCKMLTDRDEKVSCYNVINDRATQVLVRDQLDTFCNKQEESYSAVCTRSVKG